MEAQPNTVATTNKPIRCIVKLGGAAITRKNELEKINEENLLTVCSQLRSAMMPGSLSEKVLSMDWSQRHGSLDTACVAEDFTSQVFSESNSFVVVHGAGSFGHFQASKSGVHKGGLHQPLVKAGFVATRISVTSLNLEIVRALAREGIPSIGMSPFSCGWSTCERKIDSADISMITKAVNSGFIPVLHGDAVLDASLDCTILSGDVIISHLAAQMKPEFVVFLTDVLGVYDRPPSEPNAVLLREIGEHPCDKFRPTNGAIELLTHSADNSPMITAVREDGSWSVVRPVLQGTKREVEMTTAAHDTTGGMATKISEAAMIARLGVDVYIVKAATDHSITALSGKLKDSVPDDWLGTVIRFVR